MLSYTRENPIDMLSIERAETELSHIQLQVSFNTNGASAIKEDLPNVKHTVTRRILEEKLSAFLFHEKRLTPSLEGWSFVVKQMHSGEVFEFDLGFKIASTWQSDLTCKWSYDSFLNRHLNDDDDDEKEYEE